MKSVLTGWLRGRGEVTRLNQMRKSSRNKSANCMVVSDFYNAFIFHFVSLNVSGEVLKGLNSLPSFVFLLNVENKQGIVCNLHFEPQSLKCVIIRMYRPNCTITICTLYLFQMIPRVQEVRQRGGTGTGTAAAFRRHRRTPR